MINIGSTAHSLRQRIKRKKRDPEADVTAVPDLLYGEEDRVGGDSGYLGADKRDDAVKKNKAGKKIKYNISRRPPN